MKWSPSKLPLTSSLSIIVDLFPSACAMTKDKRKNVHLDLKFKKVNHKLKLLNHIKGKDCALLPYLSEESLHTIGEFLYNVIQQRIPLSKNEARKVQKILLKNKPFFSKLVDQKTKNPFNYLKRNIQNEQIGGGIVSVLSLLAPLVSSLFTR